jgi:hypothetical protein
MRAFLDRAQFSPEVDHLTYLDPDTGLRYARSVAATDEEIVEREIRDLRRELEGVEFRLAHLDDEPPPWVTEPPSDKAIERARTSLLNTRAVIFDRLSELEPEPPERTKKR